MRELQQAHKELPSEVTERSPQMFDALREMGSCSRRVERGDGWSPLQEKAIRNGEKKLKQYQQEFSKWQGKDRDNTFDAFQRDFENTIIHIQDGIFFVSSRAKEGEGSYTNEIDIDTGKITGIHNFKKATKNWHFSEVIFNQLQLVMQKVQKDIVSFDLKNWIGEHIENQETRSTVDLFLPAGTDEHTFEKGRDEFLALAGTPTAQSKFYLLAQHQKALGQKEVTSITVERLLDDDDIDININYNYG
jgi:hypothetical protein